MIWKNHKIEIKEHKKNEQFSSVYVTKEKKDIGYLKKNRIDVEKGIELLGDIEMYNETLEEFMNNIEDRMRKLEKYKEEDINVMMQFIDAFYQDLSEDPMKREEF